MHILVSERFQGSKLVESSGLSVESPSFLASSSFSLIQPQESLASMHPLDISVSVSVRYLLGLSEGSYTKLLSVNTS